MYEETLLEMTGSVEQVVLSERKKWIYGLGTQQWAGAGHPW